MDINTSIYLLTGLLMHLTLIITFIATDPEFIKIIIKFHIVAIILCLITAITYLFNGELIYLFNIKNIPRYLMLITFLITILGLIKSWKNIFSFFDQISKNNKRNEK